MKLVFTLVFAATTLFAVSYGMSEAQMKAAFKLIKNVCQPKAKVTDAQIAAMHNGDWNQDKSGMCYVQCVLNYYKLQLPDNSFDWENGVKVIEAQAPPSIKDHAIAAIKNCKDAVKSSDDKCRAAMEIAKCIYDFDPPAVIRIDIGQYGQDVSIYRFSKALHVEDKNISYPESSHQDKAFAVNSQDQK